MKLVHSSSLGLMLAAAAAFVACGAEEPSSETSSPVVTPGTTAGGSTSGGPGGTVSGGTTAGGTTSGSVGGNTTPGATAGNGGGAVPGGTPVGGVTTIMEGPCEKKVRTAGKTVPDFMIVLDRSGSMRPMAGVDCRMPDIVSQFTFCLGVDCNDPMQAMQAICGGMQTGVDRWTPAVAAVKSLTEMFQSRVSFGLTTFPGQGASVLGGGGNNGCTVGTLRVPVGLNTAGPIASALDMTQPDGFTPTGPTLQAVLQQIQSKKTSPDAEVPPQYVLLVTDGAPTCPGNDRGDNNQEAHQSTIAAIDALAKAGVKTYVIGYDATVNPTLAMKLTEYAQHGGTNNFFAVQDGPSLVSKFTEITSVVAECTYTLDMKPVDPKYVRVELDKVSLKLNDPNGWSIMEKVVTINGDACTTLRDGSKTHTLAVTVECVPPEIN